MICGISLRQHKINASIRATCKIESVRTLIRYRRLRWLGHLARMHEDRLPKQLLFGSMSSQGLVKADRPQKGWIDYVREDLSELRLPYMWYRIAQDRNEWRQRIQALLEHT